MRLNIVHGFFLPVPPISGGATEKSWFHLGREFAARGHEVTMFSRRWSNLPHTETREAVRHIRLRGHDHARSLWRNLLLDFFWSWRVHRALPPADITVVNSVALPVWLGRLKPSVGRIVIMTGRMPKGQYRHYRRIARVVAASAHVREMVAAENPALAPVSRVYGYPLNWSLLQLETSTQHPFIPAAAPGELTLGYVGRLHEEKGLLLLADALQLAATTRDLPPWRVLLCGPADVARGGSGPDFRLRLFQRLSAAVGPDRVRIIEPQFNERALAALYRSLDVFCYPSLAEKGETFGVSVAEAMAAGTAPVVSRLGCFSDFVQDGRNGLVFDHQSPDAARHLAAAVSRLLRDPALRQRLATAAREDTRRYDYPVYADALLDDFAGLLRT